MSKIVHNQLLIECSKLPRYYSQSLLQLSSIVISIVFNCHFDCLQLSFDCHKLSYQIIVQNCLKIRFLFEKFTLSSETRLIIRNSDACFYIKELSLIVTLLSLIVIWLSSIVITYAHIHTFIQCTQASVREQQRIILPVKTVSWLNTDNHRPPNKHTEDVHMSTIKSEVSIERRCRWRSF